MYNSSDENKKLNIDIFLITRKEINQIISSPLIIDNDKTKLAEQDNGKNKSVMP